MSQSTSADGGRGKGGLGVAATAAMFMTMGNGGSGAVGSSASGSLPMSGRKKQSTNRSTFAPHNAAFSGVAGVEDRSDDDGDAEYAQVQEIYPGADGGMMGGGGMQEPHMYTFSQDTTPNKGNKMRPQRPNRMDKAPSGQLGGSK